MSQNNEATTIAANALARKRAELLLEISEAGKRIARLRTELVHLDAVLRMLRPDFAAAGLPVRHRRREPSPYFAHGELTKRIYDAFREAGSTPIASVDVALKAMRAKGLDPDNDKPTRTDFVRRVTLQLGDMARKGKVERIGRGPALRWRVP
jgi:hypothetical protein